MVTIETFQGEKEVTGLVGKQSGGYGVVTGSGMSRRTWYVAKDKYDRIKEQFEEC